MTLQEYLQSVMKLRARAPNVADQSIIDSVVKGINLGPCGEYISRRKPKTVTKLFEIMQEYCISDRAKKRRLEEKNEQKKSRSSERSHSKPWHADESKQRRTVNNVSEEEPREHRHHHRGKGERDRHEERSNRDDRHHREERHNKGRRDGGGRRDKIPFCFFHGKDKGHWTNECPFAIERKEEFDRQNSQPAKPVNHTSQLPQQSSTTATTWTTTPNWPVSYPVYNYNPLSYAHQMPPPQQPVPMLPPPQYSQT